MTLDDFGGNVQAHPQPWKCFRARIVGTVEAIEDLALLLARDTDAIIAHTNRHGLIGQSHVNIHRVCSRRSEEHTSELQSRQYLVCRLLLEKKKKKKNKSL